MLRVTLNRSNPGKAKKGKADKSKASKPKCTKDYLAYFNDKALYIKGALLSATAGPDSKYKPMILELLKSSMGKISNMRGYVFVEDGVSA